MIRKGRLDKLEAETVRRWHKAWEASAVIFDRHAGDIFTESGQALIDAFLTAHPDLTTGDLEVRGVTFLESLGVRQYRAFEAWFNSYELPEEGVTDLSRWPSNVPTPPDELPGEWEKVTPYRGSDEPAERLAAELYLFLLATARATREERAGQLRP